jgi:DNA helicase-2/ATP-dependent DNA helicase PcrA
LASGEAASQIAILYRANWLSRLLESALRGAGIPYRVVQGQAFFARREIKDVVAYLNLLSNPRDHIALERVINVPPRKIGKVTIARLRAYAAAEGISLLDAARQVTRIGDISKQAAAKVAAFVALYDRLNVPADNVEAIVRHVLAASGYREYLLADETDQGLDRVANVDELVEAAREFDDRHPDDGGLDGFLEQVSLVSDTDAYDPSQPAVSLMTLHAAKGLEFDSVFIVGVEEGLLPHEFSNRDQWEIEEERRLLFVGITRAKRHLRLSRALYRARHGVLRPTVASRFLMELPRDEMHVVEPRGVTLPDHWGDSDEADQDQDFADDGIDPFDESPHRPARRGASERRSERPTEPRAGVRLATQLAEPGESDARSPGVPPEVFQNGMIVNHPIYGLGRISSLSGSGLKRTAAVDFFEGSRRTFRLALSPLVPVRRRDS